MTTGDVIRAYGALRRLGSAVLPYAKAKELWRLDKAMREEIDLIAREEKKLVARYSGSFEGDRIKFPTAEEKAGFEEERSSLYSAETELEPVDISGLTDGLRISPDDIAALEGAVIFEGGE